MKSKKIDPLEVYNVEEAAKVLDINPQTLLDYLRDGRIVAKKIGEWKILGQSLIQFLTTSQTDINYVVEENRKNAKKFRIGS